MNKKYFIFFISFIIFLIAIFTTVAIFSNTNKDNTKDKVEEEIRYIEDKLLGMANSLNNIPFSNSVILQQNTIKGQSGSSDDNGSDSGDSNSSEESGLSSTSSSGGSSGSSRSEEYTKYNVETQNVLINTNSPIDWNYLKSTVQELYTSWPNIMIDLHSLNIKNEDILNFSNNLDTLIINIQNEDKKATLNSLSILYSFIPVYKEQYLDDTDKINIAYTKTYIINSYALLEEEKWEDIQIQISKAQEYFGIIINSVNENRNQSSISKTYILLNEMNNVIKLKDKKLFYLKYINLMENAMNT